MTAFTYCDFFCGCGGFSLGFLRSGFVHVFGTDSCADTPFIQQTYEANIGRFIKQDIKDFDGTQYKGKIDVVIGSPPCKSFSVANIKTRNFDTSLIKEFMRVVKEIRPKIWIWENVDGVQKKLTKQKSLAGTDKIYADYWQSFNMSEYGMLQMRKRTFVSNINLDMPKARHEYLDGDKAWKVYMDDRGNIIRPFYTLTAHGSKRGGNFGIKVFIRGWGMRDLILEEQASIQTFPFDYKFFGSHTAIETMIGNAVPPHFSYKIAQAVKAYLEKQNCDSANHHTETFEQTEDGDE